MCSKLNLATSVGALLGIRPPLSEITIFQKAYSVFVVTFLGAMIAVSSIDRDYLNSYTHIKFAISILMDILAYFFNFYTILSTTFRHKKQWTGLMEADRNERSNYECLGFIVSNLIFWVIVIGSNYAFTRIVVFKSLQDIVVIDIELYTQFLFGYIIYQITDLLIVKYKYLRQNLEELVGNIPVKTLSGNDFSFFMRRIEHLAYALKQNVEDFNEIFGTPLFLMISYATLHFVNYVDDLFFFRFDSEKKFQFFISNVSLVGMIFLGICILIVKCDNVLTEATSVVNVTYRLRKFYPCVVSRERMEVTELINFMINNFPKFSGFGFFEIKKSTILSILGTITTLLIVLIQLDSSGP